MLSFDLPAARFNYRVAAVALHQKHVLLHRLEGDDFWALPGGRCEALERSSAALARELREELGETVRIDRLLWVVENFFTHAVRSHHELGFYYLVAFPPDSPHLDARQPFRGEEHGVPLLFQWFPLAAVPQLPIYPMFLRTALQAIPDTIQHVVNEDNREADSRAAGEARARQAHVPEAE